MVGPVTYITKWRFEMPLSKLEHLFTHSVIRKYSKRQILMYPGDKLTHVYFVKKGYAKLYQINEQGDERILMIFPPRSAFPIIPGMRSDEPYSLKYFYESMTDMELYQLTTAEFSEILGGNEETSQIMLEYVTKLAGELIRRLGIIENKDANKKLATVLQYLINVCSEELEPGQFKIKLKLTHQDIASLAGLARETTSIQLKQMEKDKMISHKSNGLLVVNSNLLPQ